MIVLYSMSVYLYTNVYTTCANRKRCDIAILQYKMQTLKLSFSFHLTRQSFLVAVSVTEIPPTSSTPRSILAVAVSVPVAALVIVVVVIVLIVGLRRR